jgi:hypothetical protein
LGDGILLPMTTLADPAEAIPLAFETDRTLVAKAVRHSRFFARYVRARYHRKDLDGLVAAVERRFSDSKGWIAERRLELRKSVGPLCNKDGIHWDAPIVVVIMYHDEQGHQKEACGMSLYLENNSLYILQLQGGKLVKFPRRFKVWPQLFLKSCIAFAQAANFDQVCVAKAETLYTYRWPDLGPNGIPRSQQSIDDHRKRMKLRYDETARVCDFKSEDDWFVWKNARLQRRWDPALNGIATGKLKFPNEEAA